MLAVTLSPFDSPCGSRQRSKSSVSKSCSWQPSVDLAAPYLLHLFEPATGTTMSEQARLEAQIHEQEHRNGDHRNRPEGRKRRHGNERHHGSGAVIPERIRNTSATLRARSARTPRRGRRTPVPSPPVDTGEFSARQQFAVEQRSVWHTEEPDPVPARRRPRQRRHVGRIRPKVYPRRNYLGCIVPRRSRKPLCTAALPSSNIRVPPTSAADTGSAC